MSTLLKVAGWNILRAASVRSLIEKMSKHGHAAPFGKLLHRFSHRKTTAPATEHSVPDTAQHTKKPAHLKQASVARVITCQKKDRGEYDIASCINAINTINALIAKLNLEFVEPASPKTAVTRAAIPNTKSISRISGLK